MKHGFSVYDLKSCRADTSFWYGYQKAMANRIEKKKLAYLSHRPKLTTERRPGHYIIIWVSNDIIISWANDIASLNASTASNSVNIRTTWAFVKLYGSSGKGSHYTKRRVVFREQRLRLCPEDHKMWHSRALQLEGCSGRVQSPLLCLDRSWQGPALRTEVLLIKYAVLQEVIQITCCGFPKSPSSASTITFIG